MKSGSLNKCISSTARESSGRGNRDVVYVCTVSSYAVYLTAFLFVKQKQPAAKLSKKKEEKSESKDKVGKSKKASSKWSPTVIGVMHTKESIHLERDSNPNFCQFVASVFTISILRVPDTFTLTTCSCA